MNHLQTTDLLSDFVCLQGVSLVTEIEKFHCFSSGGRPRRIDLTDLGRGVEFVVGVTKTTVLPSFDFGDVKPKCLETLEHEGWNVVDASHWTTQLIAEKPAFGHDYQGVVIWHANTKLALILHRGMQYTPKNLGNALLIGQGQDPPIVAEALVYSLLIWRKLHSLFGDDFALAHAGFSLGGFLAQFTSSYFFNKFQKHNVARCYDCPSAKWLIDKFQLGVNTGIWIVLTAPNIVNTCSEYCMEYTVCQISSYHELPQHQFGVSSEPVNLDLMNLSAKDSLSEWIAIAKKTLHLHDQDKLRSTLGTERNFRVKRVFRWPQAENRVTKQAGDLNIGNAESLVHAIANGLGYYFVHQMIGWTNPQFNLLTHRVPDLVIELE